MNRVGHRYIALALCVFSLAVVAPATGRASELPEIGTQPGQLYPDFFLPKLDGGFGRLSDYRGKKIILFHFASW